MVVSLASRRAEAGRPLARVLAACAACAAVLGLATNAAGQQPPRIVTTGQNFNVNPGTADQFVGDAYLQRQVEPKIVCASNNTQLCVGIANDYRTVDMTADSLTGFGEAKLRSDDFGPKTRRAAAPDAWLGLYRTSNGGRDWLNGLVPGSPIDTSALGLKQPWSGLGAGSDGALATDGVHFFGAGLFFNRGGRSMIGVFRLTAYNDESQYPIRWDDGYSQAVEVGSATSTGQFADLPSIVADVPRTAGRECGNVYLAYARFAGAPAANSFIYFSRSSDCGHSYSKPVKISGTYTMTQRVVIAIDPRPGTPTTDGGGTLYAVFRTFQSDQFVFARSTDYGATWTAPAPITNRSGPNTLCTYDQPTVGMSENGDPNEQTARAMAFASVQVDSYGTLHVVWAERVDSNGYPLAGKACTPVGHQPKIVYTRTADKGKSWSQRKAIDTGVRCETRPAATNKQYAAGIDLSSPGGLTCPANTASRYSGPQIQPALAHAAGTLMLLYSEGRANPNTDAFLGNAGYHAGRNTQMDVRAARIDPMSGALLSTTQVSRYAVDAETRDLAEVGNSPGNKAYNRPYLPQYSGGTNPFKGDHDDIVALGQFVWDSPQHFAAPGELIGVRFLSIWGGDNRETLLPGGSLNGDWWDYQNPSTGNAPSCNAGIRNSNNYVAYVGPPIEAFVEHSFKSQFDFNTGDQQRSWVVTVRNHGDEPRTLRFDLEERFGNASFSQFEDVNVIGNNPSDPYCEAGTYPVCTAYRTILPFSSMTFTVFGKVSDDTRPAPFKITVYERDASATLATDKPVANLRLNPNPNNPAPLAGTDIKTQELHGPSVYGPYVSTHTNPTPGNPTPGNPTPGNSSPGNPTPGNPTPGNPTPGNAGFSDYTDYTYVIKAADANTLSGYSAFASIANATVVDESHLVQMIITRIHKVPTLDSACTLSERVDAEVTSTITVSSSSQLSPTPGNPTPGNSTPGNPTPGNPTSSNPTPGNPTPGNATFALSPQNAPAVGPSASANYRATALASAVSQAASDISSDTGPDGTLVSVPEPDEVHVTIRFFHCDAVGGCAVTLPDGTPKSFVQEPPDPDGTQETVVPRSCSTDPCGAGDSASALVGFATISEAGDNVAGEVTPPVPVGVGPDLYVSAPATLTVTPNPVVQGGLIRLSIFTVSNQGDVAAPASSYGILAIPTTGGGPGIWLASSFNLPRIAASDSYTVSTPRAVSTADLAPGTYTVGPYLDDQNFVGETNEFNNFAGVTLVVRSPPTFGPDLIVQSLTHYPSAPTDQDLITVTATVANVGLGAAESSQVQLCVGGESPANCLDATVPALAPGDSYVVTRVITLTAQGYRNTATADSQNVVPESNESNNVTTEDYTVVVASGVTVSGVVRYSSTTLSGLTMELLAAPYGDNPPLRRTQTDANGSYSFPLVSPGDYFIKRYAPSGQGYVWWVANSATVGTADVTRDLDLPKYIWLSSPVTHATGVSCTPTLTWISNPESNDYRVQINKTTGWIRVTHTGTFTIASDTSSYTLTTVLEPNLNYTWQVDAYDPNNRWVGTTGQSFDFTTGTCPAAPAPNGAWTPDRTAAPRPGEHGDGTPERQPGRR